MVTRLMTGNNATGRSKTEGKKISEGKKIADDRGPLRGSIFLPPKSSYLYSPAGSEASRELLAPTDPVRGWTR